MSSICVCARTAGIRAGNIVVVGHVCRKITALRLRAMLWRVHARVVVTQSEFAMSEAPLTVERQAQQEVEQ